MYRTRTLPFGSARRRLVESSREDADESLDVGGFCPAWAWFARVPAAAAALAAALALGCSAGGGPAAPQRPPGPVEFRADWSDLDAAAEVAASAIEATVMGITEPEPGVRLYELRTIHDAPGLLDVRWLGGAAGSSPGEDASVRATCSIGRFGDAALEGRLLWAFERRLRALRGRDVAPLD